MNRNRVILTGIILSIVYIAMEYALHGCYLKDMYMQTASVWRPEADIAQLVWMLWLGEVIFAFMFGVIFAAGYESGKGGLGQGMRFGVLMALFLAPITGLAWFVVLPIPGMLAISWSVGTAIMMVVLGLVAGLVYRN